MTGRNGSGRTLLPGRSTRGASLGARRIAGILAAVLLPLAGCRLLGLGGAGAGMDEGVVRCGVAGGLPGLDPFVTATGWNEATAALFDGLYRFDARGQVVPDLAASLPEPIGPGRQMVRLLRTVRWHDGMPFGSNDVVRTLWRRHTLPALPDWLAALDGRLGDATPIDEHTVAIATALPAGRLATLLTRLPILPAHHIREDGTLDFMPAGPPVGTGPFVWRGVDEKGRLRLRSSRSHHLDQPRIGGLLLWPLDDPAQGTQLLRSGAIDVAPVRRQDATLLASSPSLTVHSIPTGRFLALVPNLRTGPLAILANRQRLEAALDRDALAKQLYGPGGVACVTLICPDCWAFPDHVELPSHPPFDRTDDTDEEPLEIDVVVWTEDEPARRASELLREQLDRHGITMRRRLTARPLAHAGGTENLAEKYDAILLDWDGLTDPIESLSRLLHSTGGSNPGGVSDTVLDRLLDQLGELDAGPRARQLIGQVLERVRESHFVLPLVFASHPVVARRDLRGLDLAFLSSTRELTRFAFRWRL